MKANKTTIGQEVLNHRRRKDKYPESSIDFAAHTQVLKQHKQVKWQESPHIYQH
jgi:hypothetical protein